jgi:biopolymer transport protein ExbD
MRFRNDNEVKKPLAMFSQSSLTDIVLLLLIFFLLTSSFVANLGIKINVPKAESGAPTASQFISVTIAKDGRFFVEGTLTPSGSLAESIRVEQIRTKKTSLVLRADKDAKVDDAVKVMNIAKALQLTILMATERMSPN